MKRIFVPSFIYIKDGNPLQLVVGISKKQESYNSTLTEENFLKKKNYLINFIKIPRHVPIIIKPENK